MARTLYVGNLPWATKAEDLADAFSAHGEVLSSRVITDRESVARADLALLKCGTKMRIP